LITHCNTLATGDESETAYLDELMENLLQSGGREVRIRKRNEKGTQRQPKPLPKEPEVKSENADSIAIRAKSLLSSMKGDEYEPSSNSTHPLNIAMPINEPNSMVSSEDEDEDDDEESSPAETALARDSCPRQSFTEINRRSIHSDDPPSIKRPLKSSRRRQPLDLSISQATRARRRGS
jgi:hypothetical protein